MARTTTNARPLSAQDRAALQRVDALIREFFVDDARAWRAIDGRRPATRPTPATPPRPKVRTRYLTIRVAPAARARWERVAHARGQSLTAFVEQACYRAIEPGKR